jgi:hypothetical protein
VNVAPPLGDPLPSSAAGEWVWNEVAGSQCRDGSPAGFWYKRSAASKNVMIYLEGGGVCFSPQFCALNPKNVRERMYGDVFPPPPTAGDPMAIRMESSSTPFAPYTGGIFDLSNASNPVRDWNIVSIPYCTGDVFGGTRSDAVVPGDTSGAKQQFVGYRNMQKFLGRIIPTFKDAGRVLLAGSSAGAFGAGLSFNQTQDGFSQVGSAKVSIVMDSALIFTDAFLDPCLQKQWRDLWGLNAALPPDCPECQPASGGGFWKLIPFSARKFANARLGMISGQHDSIMRLFFSLGENQCTAPFPLLEPADKYEAAITDLRAVAAADPAAARFSTYVIGAAAGAAPNGVSYDIVHQWLWNERFYVKLAGNVSPAEWVSQLLRDEATTVGP